MGKPHGKRRVCKDVGKDTPKNNDTKATGTVRKVA